jgi:hypothetical protein
MRWADNYPILQISRKSSSKVMPKLMETVSDKPNLSSALQALLCSYYCGQSPWVRNSIF